MKLSMKFFATAYVVVLLATGIGGFFIVKNITDTLWETQLARVNTAVNYVVDSFLAYADITSDKIAASQKNTLISQIEDSLADLNANIIRIEILSDQRSADQYRDLKINTCSTEFKIQDERLQMRSVCKLDLNGYLYFLTVDSDFTQIRKQCSDFRSKYAMIVFTISSASGLILFALARQITKPLKELTAATDEIALGNYGKKLQIKSKDLEILALTESVNTMSVAIKQTVNRIKEELENRDHFVSAFSHEIKTPMTAMIGYAEMLRDYDLSAEESMEATSAIVHEAKRLESLSAQLLSLYIYQNERIELENVEIQSLAEDLVKAVSPLTERYGVTLSVRTVNAVVIGNRALLHSLLYNLIDNAAKASKKNSDVELAFECRSERVSITVTDHGNGIRKENLEKITEPFFREDPSRSRKLGGAGLGLSLCKEIAKLHETVLLFESELGLGTRVSFEVKKGEKRE